MLMWTEYLNRLLGVIVGFLIVATVVSAWKHHRREPRILWSAVVALLLTGFQGWLGGRVVAHELAAWIVTTHLVVALIIVSLLIYATVTAFEVSRISSPSSEHRTTPAGPAPLRTPLWVGLLIAITLMQIALGTQVRGRIDAALDAAVPRAEALGTVGAADTLHRTNALAVLAGALVVAFFVRTRHPRRSARRFWAFAVVDLAFLQIAFGLVMAYVSLAPAAQVGHLTIATLLLGAQIVLLLLVRAR